MNEKKIPLTEAYVKAQTGGLRFLEIAFQVLVVANIVVLILDVITGFLEGASLQYLIFMLISLVMLFVVRTRKHALSERHEIYKALRHLREEQGERR